MTLSAFTLDSETVWFRHMKHIFHIYVQQCPANGASGVWPSCRKGHCKTAVELFKNLHCSTCITYNYASWNSIKKVFDISVFSQKTHTQIQLYLQIM